MAPGKSPCMPFHAFLTFTKSPPGPSRESPPAVPGTGSFSWCEAPQEHPVPSLPPDPAGNVDIHRRVLQQQGWTFLWLGAAFSTLELGQFVGCASSCGITSSRLSPHSWSWAGRVPASPGCRSQVLPGDTGGAGSCWHSLFSIPWLSQGADAFLGKSLSTASGFW